MFRNITITRRDFVRGTTAALAGVPCVVPSSALGLDEKEAPSNRVALGCIGVASRGGYNMRRLMHFGGQVVAVCDVKPKWLELAAAGAKLPKSAAHSDFRDLLARREVDAVMIAPPDHWHAYMAVAAAKAGKDIYLEKPMGTTIAECQAIRKAVLASKCVFMHGTEQRGQPGVRKVCELVRNGRLGKLHTITVATPGGQESPPQREQPIPKGFDYDMWLGPAPEAFFTAGRTGRIDPKKRLPLPWERGFYFISDYTPAGFIGNWGIHHLDIAQWALDADNTGPVEIEGRATFPKPDNFYDTPLTWHIEYKYANGVKMTFTDTSENPQGFRFEGTEGWIFKPHSRPASANPNTLLDSVIGPDEIHLYETDEDNHNFLECVKSRKATCSPIEAAVRSTTVGYLGFVSAKLGRKLHWDPEKERFKEDPEADKMLARESRAPWRV